MVVDNAEAVKYLICAWYVKQIHLKLTCSFTLPSKRLKTKKLLLLQFYFGRNILLLYFGIKLQVQKDVGRTEFKTCREKKI